MTDVERWREGNDRYLSAALAWLRLRLERLAAMGGAPPGTPPTALAPVAPVTARRVRRTRAARQDALALPAGSVAIDAALEAAAEELAAAQDDDPPPAAVLLAGRLGLTDFECTTLLLCAAPELDPGIPALCARAQDGAERPYPTFALALALGEDPAWDALSTDGPLRSWRLVEVDQRPDRALTASPLRADERIVDFLKGHNHLDDRLVPLLEPLGGPESDSALPPSQQGVVDAVTARLGGGGSPPVQLVGRSESSRRAVARQVAGGLGLHLYRLRAELLPTQPQELETLARLWHRDSLLLPVALLLEAAGDTAPLRQFLRGAGGVVFVAVRDPLPDAGEAITAFEVGKPTPDEQRRLWAAALGDGDLPAALAGQFDLDTEDVRRLGAAVPPEGLWDTCRAATRPRVERLAQRVDAKATWEDLVVPDEELRTLRHLAAQVPQRATVYDDWGFRDRMNRGFGITALFSGESGTGKSMAAEVIANDLRLDLYRIDLSAVVDKYIGETEKNLRTLFDGADDGGAILLFDEADALFGKRSEVRDSHDRYANIEVNYLLQRMESYRGLAILATNLRGALDGAFLRRLRFVVTFPYPDQGLRRRLWERALPAGVPREPLDLDRLARFPLTGARSRAPR
jgi:hypothetical protein